MSFSPRIRFPFPTRTPSWFAGHMARSLAQLPQLLTDIDIVIEARDARLPLTSVNAAFDDVLRQSWGMDGKRGPTPPAGHTRQKVVVYTKRDLAESRYERPLKRAFAEHAGQEVIFADTRSDRDVRSILKHVVDHAKHRADTLVDLKVLVVGMPNVGKSSLLNALRRVGVRRGKAFRIGAEPGITRRLTGTVKVHEEPNVYVYDTPGVMVSYLGRGEQGAERGLKLALTAGIKASLFEPDILADYLLYRLNLRSLDPSYPSYLSSLPLPPDFTTPTNDLHDLLLALATRIGAVRHGGELNLEAAQRFFLRAFQEGKFGKWTLDDVVGGEDAGKDVGEDALSEGNVPIVRPPPPPPLPLPSGPDLDSLVSARVRTFLATQAHEQARRAEGIAESATQAKKQERARVVAEREAKWEAKVARRAAAAEAGAGRLTRSTAAGRRR